MLTLRAGCHNPDSLGQSSLGTAAILFVLSHKMEAYQFKINLCFVQESLALKRIYILWGPKAKDTVSFFFFLFKHLFASPPDDVREFVLTMPVPQEGKGPKHQKVQAAPCPWVASGQ